MQLSEKAKNELKNILFKEFGEKSLVFSDVEINEVGSMLLGLTAISLKRKINTCAQSKEDSKI